MSEDAAPAAPRPAPVVAFLCGCGEVGAHLRACDWSHTPLGLPEQWPEGLRVAATLALSARFPALVGWGPELALLYNDAYIPFLAPGRHPDALGRPAREAWSELWERIGPVADEVLATGRPGWAADIPLWVCGPATGTGPAVGTGTGAGTGPAVGAGPLAQAQVCLGFAVSPVFGPDGAVQGLFCSCSETREILEARALIATSRSLEERVRQAEERAHEVDVLREADRQKDKFLATLAHELRNPLAPIRQAVQIMRMKSPVDPELEQARDIIERQTAQLVHLVDDLLEISRIGRGRIHLQLQRVDLGTAIATAVESSRSLIDSAGHTLTVQLPAQPLYVEGDPTRLSQIFANLLNNAAKYTPARGRIDLTAQVEGSHVAVQVTDTGVGIPQEMLERIFDMFAQVDASLERTQGGLGIGLTVAQQLVQLHSGRIEAHSEGEQRGSTFTVHLPLMSPEPEGGSAAAAEGRGGPQKVSRKVLIADDNRDSAESLAVLLQMFGHEVRTASDGLKAVELAESFHPDVALLDIGMPELNGYEAAARIRALPDGARILLLALTGWGQDADRQLAAEAGFDYHITKPADLDLLQQILAEVPGSG